MFREKNKPCSLVNYRALFSIFMAENGGFEPPEACTSIDFKSTAIDRSANSPFFTQNARNYST